MQRKINTAKRLGAKGSGLFAKAHAQLAVAAELAESAAVDHDAKAEKHVARARDERAKASAALIVARDQKRIAAKVAEFVPGAAA